MCLCCMFQNNKAFAPRDIDEEVVCGPPGICCVVHNSVTLAAEEEKRWPDL